MKEKVLWLDKEQFKHFDNCPFVETCELCSYICKKLDKGYVIKFHEDRYENENMPKM